MRKVLVSTVSSIQLLIYMVVAREIFPVTSCGDLYQVLRIIRLHCLSFFLSFSLSFFLISLIISPIAIVNITIVKYSTVHWHIRHVSRVDRSVFLCQARWSNFLSKKRRYWLRLHAAVLSCDSCVALCFCWKFFHSFNCTYLCLL